MKSNEDKEKEFNKRSDNEAIIHNAANSDYKYGFVTDIDMHIIPKGLLKHSNTGSHSPLLLGHTSTFLKSIFWT